MAKVKFTAIVADMRNKLNGSVFSSNKAGAYIRTKVTPTNPRTADQQSNRSLLGSLSSAWRGLGDTVQKGWIAAAESFPYRDIFGDTKKLSGNALYISLNKNLVQAGQAQITDAPAPEELPVLLVTAGSANGSTGAVTVTVSETSVPSGHTLMIAATPNVSAGVNFVKNLYRTLGHYTLTAGVATITADYAAKFGAPVTGQKIGLMAWLVNDTTGQTTVESSILVIVA